MAVDMVDDERMEERAARSDRYNNNIQPRQEKKKKNTKTTP